MKRGKMWGFVRFTSNLFNAGTLDIFVGFRYVLIDIYEKICMLFA